MQHARAQPKAVSDEASWVGHAAERALTARRLPLVGILTLRVDDAGIARHWLHQCREVAR
jgi:hypothetical protein